MHFNFYFGVQPPLPEKKKQKKRDSSAVTPFYFMYLMYKNINPKKGNIDKDMNLVSFNPRNALNKKQIIRSKKSKIDNGWSTTTYKD